MKTKLLAVTIALLAFVCTKAQNPIDSLFANHPEVLDATVHR